MTTTPDSVFRSWCEHLAAQRRLERPVYVTRPTMPPLDLFYESLEEIWASGWLTNCGAFHERLEARLASFLGVEHISLVSSGTTGLEIGLRVLGVERGEVITTPFTFPATVHVLRWLGLTPVFADVDAVSLNLDPSLVEEKISADTVAILPVHVFGTPCDVRSFDELRARTGLNLIYDAAHAFGVRLQGRPLLSWGDVSVLSFHATKLFSTAEGGAVVCRSAKLKEEVDLIRNFGIRDEDRVPGVGINGKLSELHAAFGLLQLKGMTLELEKRGVLARRYRETLRDVPGIGVPSLGSEVRGNHGYFPIRVDAEVYGSDRDRLASLLRSCNIHCRRYFSPLVSEQPPYGELDSARRGSLPVATRAAREILCLPLYGTLEETVVEAIGELVRDIHHRFPP